MGGEADGSLLGTELLQGVLFSASFSIFFLIAKGVIRVPALGALPEGPSLLFLKPLLLCTFFRVFVTLVGSPCIKIKGRPAP